MLLSGLIVLRLIWDGREKSELQPAPSFGKKARGWAKAVALSTAKEKKIERFSQCSRYAPESQVLLHARDRAGLHSRLAQETNLGRLEVRPIGLN